MHRLILIGGLLAACGGKSAKECRTEAEALGTLLRDTPHEMTAFFPQSNITLVKRTDLTTNAPDLESLVIAANTEVTTFEGMPLNADDDLRERLETVRRRRTAKDYRQMFFQLDRLTPWSKVVQLVDAAKRAGLGTVGFAFETGAKLTPPARTPIDDKLDAIMNGEASTKAVELARLLETIVEPCPALHREFGKVGAEGTESKADIIIRGLAPALIECKCSVDMPALRSAMWRLLAVDPNIKVLGFDATTGDRLALPGATTWEAASKKLAPGKSYVLVAE